jgi:segregation and condensation protein B
LTALRALACSRGVEGEVEAGELDEGVAVAEAAAEGPAEAPDERTLERQLGALLFASPEPLTLARLAKLCGDAPQKAVAAALEGFGQKLASAGLPFELCAIAGGWQLLTSPDTAACVARLAKSRKEEKVSPASLETLAIVAYRQPVTKAEIEAIRGVQVGPILRSLVDRGLVRVAGRSDVPGHPLVYATTKKFLEAFGLGAVGDLPRDSELLRD